MIILNLQLLFSWKTWTRQSIHVKISSNLLAADGFVKIAYPIPVPDGDNSTF